MGRDADEENMSRNATKRRENEAARLKVELPVALCKQITTMAGRRGVSAFLREAVEQEIERRRLLATMPVTNRAAM